MKLQVDECPDANGCWTLRPHDGTPNGDLIAQPIATVYDRLHALQIVEIINHAHARTENLTHELD